VGALWRSENADAVRWMLQTVWPRVRSRIPTARFRIVGAGAPPWLASDPASGVDVAGFVDDLDPAYRGAAAAIAVSLTGAGVQFKVLHAMAYGLPVVASRVASEGIVEESGPGCFVGISDEPAELAGAVIRALTGEPAALQAAHAGRRFVEGRFTAPACAGQTLARYRSMVGVPA
jgi:glycosyltransferase involved in cell wall biosynthesis